MGEYEMTSEEFAKIVAGAAETGTEDGKAAATWVFDGNTTEETWRSWRTMRADNDPTVWDSYPSALSGELADDLTPRALLADLGVDPDSVSDEECTEVCDAYEAAHTEAWADEVDRAIAAHFEDES